MNTKKEGKRYGAGSGWWLEREELADRWVGSGKRWQGRQQWLAMAKCEEVIRVGREYRRGKGSLFEKKKKKKNDKKEKRMKKRVGKGDKKKMGGTFPLSEILSGKRTKRRPIQKKEKKRKGQNGGNFPTQ